MSIPKLYNYAIYINVCVYIVPNLLLYTATAVIIDTRRYVIKITNNSISLFFGTEVLQYILCVNEEL